MLTGVWSLEFSAASVLEVHIILIIHLKNNNIDKTMKHDHFQMCKKKKKFIVILEIQQDHLHLSDKSFTLMGLYLCA